MDSRKKDASGGMTIKIITVHLLQQPQKSFLQKLACREKFLWKYIFELSRCPVHEIFVVQCQFQQKIWFFKSCYFLQLFFYAWNVYKLVSSWFLCDGQNRYYFIDHVSTPVRVHFRVPVPVRVHVPVHCGQVRIHVQVPTVSMSWTVSLFYSCPCSFLYSCLCPCPCLYLCPSPCPFAFSCLCPCDKLINSGNWHTATGEIIRFKNANIFYLHRWKKIFEKKPFLARWIFYKFSKPSGSTPYKYLSIGTTFDPL